MLGRKVFFRTVFGSICVAVFVNTVHGDDTSDRKYPWRGLALPSLDEAATEKNPIPISRSESIFSFDFEASIGMPRASERGSRTHNREKDTNDAAFDSEMVAVDSAAGSLVQYAGEALSKVATALSPEAFLENAEKVINKVMPSGSSGAALVQNTDKHINENAAEILGEKNSTVHGDNSNDTGPLKITLYSQETDVSRSNSNSNSRGKDSLQSYSETTIIRSSESYIRNDNQNPEKVIDGAVHGIEAALEESTWVSLDKIVEKLDSGTVDDKISQNQATLHGHDTSDADFHQGRLHLSGGEVSTSKPISRSGSEGHFSSEVTSSPRSVDEDAEKGLLESSHLESLTKNLGKATDGDSPTTEAVRVTSSSASVDQNVENVFFEATTTSQSASLAQNTEKVTDGIELDSTDLTTTAASPAARTQNMENVSFVATTEDLDSLTENPREIIDGGVSGSKVVPTTSTSASLSQNAEKVHSESSSASDFVSLVENDEEIIDGAVLDAEAAIETFSRGSFASNEREFHVPGNNAPSLTARIQIVEKDNSGPSPDTQVVPSVPLPVLLLQNVEKNVDAITSGTVGQPGESISAASVHNVGNVFSEAVPDIKVEFSVPSPAILVRKVEADLSEAASAAGAIADSIPDRIRIG